MLFCPNCETARDRVKWLLSAPWEYVLAQYEFMIVFASFQRNVVFYANADRGRLRNLYSRLVSFSAARILPIDTLGSVYNNRGLGKNEQCDSLDVLRELSKVITLAIGNCVPVQFVHKCISSCTWKGYDDMVIAAFASAESVRCGALKYMAIVKENTRDRRSLHIIVSAAVTGWMLKLSNSKCTCCTWPQVVDMISCFVPDTETTLTIQDKARVSAYICTLLDLRIPQSDLSRGPAFAL
ncbi:hypothetical protein DPEC_G00265610 [Dallia pectoralis]|uniref:Uncharacterized protein n=1 Tax=Dallia pectoralis TaxID=75939 RepID=A0ACC2FMX2_DALPE|nr:hypothetical protein DPEC_G00265610 [Dallia pectoralis]